jgi:hypothetical protein
VLWRLVATYSRPGDLVVTLSGHASTAYAARVLDRRHSALVTVGDGPAVTDLLTEPPLGPTRRAALRVVAVCPATAVRVLHGAAGRVRLLVARFPDTATTGPDPDEISRWVEACAVALKPGGFLVATVPAHDAEGRYVDHSTGLVAAGQRAGLRYHQHLVTIDDHLCEELLRPAEQAVMVVADGAAPLTHRRVHTDIFVLYKSEAVDA